MKKKKEKEKEEVPICEGTGAKKPGGKGRRTEKDEVMRITECRGIGGQGGSRKTIFISGANKGQHHVMAVLPNNTAVNCIL